MATDGDELMATGPPGPQPAEVVAVDGDSGTEVQLPVMFRAPCEPTTQECAEHEATGQVAYRSWCDACLAGKGLGQAHRAAPKGEQEIAVAEFIGGDGFMGQEEGKCMLFLALNTQRLWRL